MSGTSTTAFEDALKVLLTSLESHEKFREQKNRRKGKVYFMWDFANNTLRMLDLSQNNPERQSEVVQRCMFANVLFNDTTGKLALMCGGDQTDFGADIRAKSEACQTKAAEWGASQGVLSS